MCNKFLEPSLKPGGDTLLIGCIVIEIGKLNKRLIGYLSRAWADLLSVDQGPHLVLKCVFGLSSLLHTNSN